MHTHYFTEIEKANRIFICMIIKCTRVCLLVQLHTLFQNQFEEMFWY